MARYLRILLSIFGLLVLQVNAQEFPNKLLTLVVPYPAGGPSDVVGRKIQPQLMKSLGQNVIVDNTSGANGSLGVQRVINSGADGYNALLGTPMELVQAPLAISAVKYKPDDMRLVGIVMNTNMVLVGRKNLPFNTVEELIQYAKNPKNKELSYGSLGAGSMYHLVAERFKQQSKIKMLHVPYKGGAPLMQDLMGEQIDLVFFPLAGNLPSLIESGQIKAFGITTSSSHPNFPKIPPMSQVKALKDFLFDIWIGVELPKGTPEAVVKKWHEAVASLKESPDVKKAIEDMGGRQPNQMLNQADLDKFYKQEISRYQAIAKSINLEAQ
jgi:tripartite-type tricarboxylate transporter receptor subunit TctC